MQCPDCQAANEDALKLCAAGGRELPRLELQAFLEPTAAPTVGKLFFWEGSATGRPEGSPDQWRGRE